MAVQNQKSRAFTIIDVPDPRTIKARFVYNFFTPDERINDSGDKRVKGVNTKYLQNLKNANTLESEVPRYVEINFDEVHIDGTNYNDSKNQSSLNPEVLISADSEETITNIGFASFRETDESAVPRLKEKLGALSSVLGLSFSDSSQSKKLASKLNVSQNDIQDVITPANDPSSLLVNAKSTKDPDSVFEIAANAKFHGQVNKRVYSLMVQGAEDTSPLSKISVINDAAEITKNFVAIAKDNFLLGSDIDPSFHTLKTPKETTRSKQVLGASVLGYVITRNQYNDDGTKYQTKSFVLPGATNNSYLDTEVIYGATYSYDVRSIVKVDAIVEGEIIDLEVENEVSQTKNWEISTLIASRPTSAVRVRTEEFVAPTEPDGVFYSFNYDEERGLLIRWQMPAGKSRDTKYFQVFRRKTIFEPFVLIGMIDFDDSVVRHVMKEMPNTNKVIPASGAQTFFEDVDFTRDSSYIYAIAAVDAHGLTSGYSMQTKVGFNKAKNSLTLDSISRGGAPKQYPNFYVDPKLDDNFSVDSFVQDAIFDSGHKTMRIYFTPDARTIGTADGKKEDAFYTKNAMGVYQVQFINLDHQKSDIAKLEITDLR